MKKKNTSRSKKRTSKKQAAPKKKLAKKKTSKKKAPGRTVAKKKATKKTAKKRVVKKKIVKKKIAKKKTSKKKVTKKKAAKKKTAKKKTTKKTAKAKTKKKQTSTKRVSAPKAPVETSHPKRKRKEPNYAAILERLPYKEGDFVVHPRYGLGLIKRILDHEMNEATVPCFKIHFSYQEMRLTIPVDQVEKSGLRNPMVKKDVEMVFKTLRGRATFDGKQRSAKRVADYQKRVHLGDPLSLAEVVRDLSRLSLKKTLSYEERKILSEAMRVLSREVALALSSNANDVIEEIESIVNR